MCLFLKRLGIVALGLWCAGGIYYYYTIHAYPKATTVKTDAIVVLTGGSGRLSRGVKLFLKNAKAQLFVTGVNSVTTKNDLQSLTDLTHDQLWASLTLGYEAQDTEGNAKETKQWVLQNNLRSIALVTAHYHMPRSLIEFGILENVRIIPVAVTPDLFCVKGKWDKKIQVLFFEYNKFVLALMKCFLKGQ